MASVVVTPLQPPFFEDVMHFQFKDAKKQLTVSIEDGRSIMALLGDKPMHRQVMLEYVDDDHVRVNVVQ